MWIILRQHATESRRDNGEGLGRRLGDDHGYAHIAWDAQRADGPNALVDDDAAVERQQSRPCKDRGNDDKRR